MAQGGKGRKPARSPLAPHLHHPHHGARALVPAVEDAAELLVVLQEGVGLVDQQRGLRDPDNAERRRRGQAVGGDGAATGRGEQVDQGGLAAALRCAGDRQPRGDEARRVRKRVQNPEGDLGGIVVAERQMLGDERLDLVQQDVASDRLRPRVGVREVDRLALPFALSLSGAGVLHRFVERREPHLEPLGLALAHAVVLVGRQLGEPGDLGLEVGQGVEALGGVNGRRVECDFVVGVGAGVIGHGKGPRGRRSARPTREWN